jgi:uncharacterized RDD family membrane protein YckC
MPMAGPAPGQGWWNGIGPIPQDGLVLGNGYAGWWQRLGASLIDGLIVGGVGTVVGGVMIGVEIAADWDRWQRVERTRTGVTGYSGIPTSFWFVYGAFLLVALIGVLLYEVLCNAGAKQGTPGKRAVGVLITSSSGQRLSKAHALGRWAAKLIYGIPYLNYLLYGVSAITIGVTEKKQGLHDMMAGTVVVRKHPKALMAVTMPPGQVPPGYAPPGYAPPPVQQ